MDVTADYNKKCPECKGKSQVVLDHSSGDLVCTGCGLVLEERCFDEGAEWRSFAPEGVGSGNDGGPARQRADFMSGFNALLEEFEAGTSLVGTTAMAAGLAKAMRQVESAAKSSSLSSSAAGGSAAASSSSGGGATASGGRGVKRSAAEGAGGPEKRQATRQDDAKIEKLIRTYTAKCREVASRLTLGENIVNRCTAFLQDIAEKGSLEQNKRVGYFCGLVYLAAREEKAAQSVRDIAYANADSWGRSRQSAAAAARRNPASQAAIAARAGPDAQRALAAEKLEQQIHTQVKDLTKLLGLAKPVAYALDQEHINRLVKRCDLGQPVADYAAHMVNVAYRQAAMLGPKIAQTPQDSLLAACVFVIAWLLDLPQKPSFMKVAALAKVSEASVRNTYALVHPALGYLVPPTMPIRLQGGARGLPPLR